MGGCLSTGAGDEDSHDVLGIKWGVRCRCY
jgi:hypothetical protein